MPTLKYALGSDWGKHVGNVDVTSSLNGRSNTQREDLKIANMLCQSMIGGAMVARLTPDQKIACSNHIRVSCRIFNFLSNQKLIRVYFFVHLRFFGSLRLLWKWKKILNANTSPHYCMESVLQNIYTLFFIRTLKLRFDVLKSGSQKMFMLP